jgi:hypothetical protein
MRFAPLTCLALLLAAAPGARAQEAPPARAGAAHPARQFT